MFDVDNDDTDDGYGDGVGEDNDFFLGDSKSFSMITNHVGIVINCNQSTNNKHKS